MTHPIVLIGLECVGKTSLFRQLTDDQTVRETNFHGSTVFCHTNVSAEGARISDTPGIRFGSDSVTTQLALDACNAGERICLVARLPSAHGDLLPLLTSLDLQNKKIFLALTHADKSTPSFVNELLTQLALPVAIVNARAFSPADRKSFFQAARAAAPWVPARLATLPPTPPISIPKPANPPTRLPLATLTLALTLAALIGLFGLPIYASYRLSEFLQPLSEAHLLAPVQGLGALLPAFPRELLVGSYGMLTLGWYSFLWAFPVVALLGVSMAVAEETGLVQALSARLDPLLRKVGLSGRDLIPVLTGFGCNVVAVLQTRACSRCNRSACVSLISFGSACSYQIGASLSIFSSARKPWLFFPYLALLFLAGAAHNRLWHGTANSGPRLGGGGGGGAANAPALQWPTRAGTAFRAKSVIKQFIFSAMPIFLGICLASTLLSWAGALDAFSALLASPLHWLGLPESAAPGVAFSFLRKDGLLLLNQDQGALLAGWSAAQIFLVVFLASTLSPCLVTLYTVGRELGFREAGRLAYRQAITSVGCTAILGAALHAISGAT